MKSHKRLTYLFALAVLLVGALVGVAACGGEEGGTGTSLAGGEKPVSGGTFKIYIGEPAFIDPVNLQESEGTQVGNQLFDSLTMFDYKTGNLLPAAAEKWEANADATVWTFHLVKDAKFHNGRKVTAADFKYAWERICNPANESEISYHLSCVKGYDAMQEGKATELEGVKVIDDYTLEVTLSYPFGDFEYVVGHPALAPVPKEEVEKDPKAFSEMPIGNGPFKMAEPWQHDQYIKVVRFDDYYGQKAHADGIDFMIFNDDETAFMEFEAGNLDMAVIPSGRVKEVMQKYGVSDDGLEVAPGKQTLTGPETAIYYLTVNNKDQYLSNKALRQALSLAINRQAICDTIFEGLREPATGIVPWGVAGYIKDQWPYSKYDPEAAKAKLAEAGYPNGQGLPEITLSCNSGRGHEDILAMVQADFAAIGVKSKIEAIEWAQYLDKLGAGTYQIGRLGWIADYPIMDNFLYPLFTTGSGDNYSFYSNPAVDQALLAARSIVNTEERIAKYQEIERTIGEDAPVIPITMYRHGRVGSDRVRGLVESPQGLYNLEQAWIVKDRQ